MLFSSNIFLFLFLPITILGYYLIHPKLKNSFLLIMSLIFYAWGEPKFVLIMLASIIFNYIMAIAISFAKNENKVKNVFLSITVFVNLLILYIFKYLDFTIINLNKIGFEIAQRNIVLPIGISFFTFQAMSYVIDVYRGDVVVQRKIQNLGLYITFFPQLIAGPIIRYKDVDDQINSRNENFLKFSEGIKRFIIGFNKKIILSNIMALIADEAFLMDPSGISISMSWLGAIAYSFQILYDFSGYSDMAIGLGKMFGFDFLENFDFPYISKSISEFWRRWHMSLGQWFRDYVYFPLGGSRVKSELRLVFNLFVVWFLTGLWHGANWTFIVWGLFYFLIITFEKITGIPDMFTKSFYKKMYRVFTMISVIIGWVLFRSPDLQFALSYLKAMFNPKNTLFSIEALFLFKEYFFFLFVSHLLSFGFVNKLKYKVTAINNKKIENFAKFVYFCFIVVGFIWAISYIVLGSHNPFIYFNF